MFIFSPALLSAIFLAATVSTESTKCPDDIEQCPADASDEEVNVYLEQNYNDEWFGPGYYYGLWFAQPYAYQSWRYDHRDYPSNRHYYNHDHPVHYHGGDHHDGHGGHGGHGGGRHGDGGGHGGHGGGRHGGGGGHGGHGGHR